MLAINSVKITSAEGIGFAVPINIVKPIIEKFISENKFDEAYLGIFAYDREAIPYLDSNISFERGIYIAEVLLDGPSFKSGLKVGDIITQIDGNSIDSMSKLRQYIYTKSPNDTINLTFLRNNKENNITITLGKRSP